MAYPATKKQRCISAIKHRLKIHNPVKAFRLVSDLEQVPLKTLQSWWYPHQRQEKAKAEAGSPKKSKTDFGIVTEISERSDCQHSLLSPSPTDPPTEPPYLDTDTGQLRCSRCKSSQHIEEREDDTYYCQLCQVVLQFSGFTEDYELKTHGDSGAGPWSWMR